MPRRIVAAVVMMGLLAPVSARQSQDVDLTAAIRQEANAHSQIMRTLHVLTDVYGPRVTGSPNLKAAGQWAVDTLESWGLTRGRLEPWEFGHPGWVNERLSAHMVSPVTRSADERGARMDAGDQRHDHRARLPPRASRSADPRRARRISRASQGQREREDRPGGPEHRGAGEPEPASRSAPTMSACVRNSIRAATPAAGGEGVGAPQGTPPPMTNAEISRRIDDFLVANGALLRINDARRELGQIAAFYNSTYDLTQSRPDGRDAERRLRPHRPHPRGRHAGGARVQHREQGVPGRPYGVQRDRGDRRDRQAE